MDFGVVGFDNFGSSVSKNSSFASENAKMYGSGSVSKHERTLIHEKEDDLLREFKMAKTIPSSSSSSCGEAMTTRIDLQRCSNNLIEGHQQMLSFSSPTVTLPLYHHTSSRSPGYGYGWMNPRSMVSELRGPFTASQVMELQHQALIYKYITANVPIPSHLLNPITKAFHSSCLRTNACKLSTLSEMKGAFVLSDAYTNLDLNWSVGWGGFHLGFSNTDPEPGRCRRTDGKKWRCAKDAVVEQKYCERHLNRGRNRSRKPVEQQPPKLPPTPSSTPASVDRSPLNKEIPKESTYSISKQQSGNEEFGLVCSDSLLNPLNRSSSLVNFNNYDTISDNETKSQHALRQFMDNWPKNQSAKQSPTISWPEIDVQQPDRTQLSISIPTYDKHGASLSREIEATQMGLGVGSISVWESSMGGPLGEVLHTNGKALNLMENWNSPSSPTRVLQRGAFGSLSNSSAGSSPRGEINKALDGVGLYGGGPVNPSMRQL